MEKVNYISNELKKKIINDEELSKKEIDTFFEYLKYKVFKMVSYKDVLDDNISLEYASICSEILFSHNIESNVYEVNMHYYCVGIINNSKYLFDYCIDKYNNIEYDYNLLLEYKKYVEEKYHE